MALRPNLFLTVYINTLYINVFQFGHEYCHHYEFRELLLYVTCFFNSMTWTWVLLHTTQSAPDSWFQSVRHDKSFHSEKYCKSKIEWTLVLLFLSLMNKINTI